MHPMLQPAPPAPHPLLHPHPGSRPPAPPARAAAAAPPPPALPVGISTRERDVQGGDEYDRLVKRRKPTDRSLPLSFARPTTPASAAAGPSDRALAPSLAALDRLAGAYAQLQQLERTVDWTLARRALEAAPPLPNNNNNASALGPPFRRTLRIHLTATALDQPWQLDPDHLARAAAADPPDAADPVPVPRVQVRITGEVLDDDRYPAASTPFTTFLHRLVLETPTRDPAVHPVGSQPLAWTRPAAHAHAHTPASLPAALESTHPLSGPSTPPTPTPSAAGDSSTPAPVHLDLKLSLYLHHPAGDRYALHPELAHVLDTAEADRVGVLEALWSYAKARGLVVDATEGGGSATGAAAAASTGHGAPNPGAAAASGAPKSGIKPDDRLKKFFGNVPLVQFHHLPEYLNRLLLPPPPRQVTLSIPLSAEAFRRDQHFAFDTPLYVPSPAQPALDAAARGLAALLQPTKTTTETPDPLESTTAPASVPIATELAALDDQQAINALAVRQHAEQLHALQAFARDPCGFLEAFTERQAGALDDVLSGSGSSGGGHLGPRGRDELRRAERWDPETQPWVREAVEVWALRDAEGAAHRLRAQQQQPPHPPPSSQHLGTHPLPGHGHGHGHGRR